MSSVKSRWMLWTERYGSPVLWSLLLVVGSIAAVVFFRPCWDNDTCTGGASPGIFFGIAGFAGIVFSMFYTLRKDLPRFSMFPLQDWLYGHVVVGTLSLVLVVAHSGFRLNNVVAAIALLFLVITVISGVVGLFLFYLVPRKQAQNETSVLLPDDLCRRLSRLHEEISEICSGREGVFLRVYNELVIPLYRTEVGKSAPPLADVSSWAEDAPPEESERFMNLAVKVEEVHDTLVLLGRHMKFRWIIRGWLMVHIPATIGLLVFTITHLISMFWYGVP